jgi:hypothetical protein
VDGLAYRADLRASGLRAGEQGEDAARCPRGAIVVLDARPPARRPHMLAQELAGLGGEQADMQIVPLHLDALADPAGRRAVVRGLDLDAAIEVATQ